MRCYYQICISEISLGLVMSTLHHNMSKHNVLFSYIKAILSQLFLLINVKIGFVDISTMENAQKRMFQECFECFNQGDIERLLQLTKSK